MHTPQPPALSRTPALPTLVTCAALLLSAAAPTVAQPRTAAPPASDGHPALVVDLSTASAAELEQIPGIGPAKAQAIIELRTRNRGIHRVEDILRVRGIGRATFRRIRPMLRVSTPAPESNRRPAPSGAAQARARDRSPQ